MLNAIAVPVIPILMAKDIGDAAASGCAPSALSWRLRTETRAEHMAVERCTGWPATIRDLDDYRACLRGLLSIWHPFEVAIAAQRDWDVFSIGHRPQSRLTALRRDLRLLGDDPNGVSAAAIVLPHGLPGMIGALYVLEGSALGGRVILSDLQRRLGPALGDATTFFASEGSDRGSSWRDVVRAVDAFGSARAEACDAVVFGARQTFAAFLHVFAAAPATAEFTFSGALS